MASYPSTFISSSFISSVSVCFLFFTTEEIAQAKACANGGYMLTKSSGSIHSASINKYSISSDDDDDDDDEGTPTKSSLA